MIEVQNLTKQFRKSIRGEGLSGMFKTLFSSKSEVITAVDSISFNIKDGEIVGYIGSNGAGKSTSIKMMCGILTPSSGKVLIDGIEPYKKRRQIAKNIGVVFGQKTQLWWDIPLIESFKVLKEIYSIPQKEYTDRMEFLKETLGIGDFLNQSVRTLSLGQRMRADLAASWLHNPKVLFLDEPTIGLDVLVKEKIREAIKSMNRIYNTTVILTTHDMQDIEDLCSRIIMIDKGKIIYDGSLENVKNQFGNTKTISLSLKEIPTEESIKSLNNFNGRLTYKIDESNLLLTFCPDQLSVKDVVNYSFTELNAQDMKISDIGIEDIVKDILEESEK